LPFLIGWFTFRVGANNPRRFQMKCKHKPIEGNGIKIDLLRKYVNVSKSGHGIVTCRIQAHRFQLWPVTQLITHEFGRDDGPHGKNKLPGLKAMARKCMYKGQNALDVDNALKLRPSGFNSPKAIWKEIKGKHSELGFSLDINKNFKRDNNLIYTWLWSRKDMFDPKNLNRTYYSGIKIEYPTELLYYQLAFGESMRLKGNPVLVKVDCLGRVKRIKKLIKRPEAHEDYGILEMNKDDFVCNYYWFVLKNPDLGSTYRIVWQTKDEGGDKPCR
jgi:hypothetical protein